MKRCLFFSTAFFLCFSAWAQPKRNLSLGPMVGLNVSTITGDAYGTASTKTGLAAGIFFNYSIKQTFGVSGQLLYSQLGANVSSGQLSRKFKLDYFQIPLFATFYFGQGLGAGTIRPKLFLGPYVGFLLSAKDQDGNPIRTPQGNASAINPLDFGVNLGGGLNYALKNQSWINIDVRYGLGILDIGSGTGELRNGAFSVMTGISFPLGNYDERTRRIKP
ncbi:MAG: PorT family protein [Cytophagaceae bacterium]|nr:PorT family protein [Cytophagaceae bacterium]